MEFKEVLKWVQKEAQNMIETNHTRFFPDDEYDESYYCNAEYCIGNLVLNVEIEAYNKIDSVHVESYVDSGVDLETDVEYTLEDLKVMYFEDEAKTTFNRV